jgi:nucleoid-associated protein YgaU
MRLSFCCRTSRLAQRRSSAPLTLNLRLGRLDDRKKSAQGCSKNPGRHQSGKVLSMTATSIVRIVVPSLALVAACSAAIVVGITQLRHEPPLETSAATAVPVISPPASSVQDKSSAALATAEAEAKAVAAELAVSPLSPATDASAPVFDIARIEPTGDAVIAGRAAPGATVELLRNGERHDQAVADQSGQFVIVPPRLPPGNYELTLRSRLPDGTLATSKHGVAVALDQAPSSTGALQSHAEVPSNVPGAAASRLPQDVAASQPLHANATTAVPDRGPPSAAVEPKMATTVVSRGDSLWRISRLTYGVGTRYAVVYRANRDRIRDPNRIYPGQVFVLPVKQR